MKKFAGILLVLFLLGMAPLHLSNGYLRSSDFDIVTIHPNESVWNVAQRYTTENRDTARLVEAIAVVNGLDADANVRYGQKLRVPVLKRNGQPQLAER